jgi:protein TonB
VSTFITKMTALRMAATLAFMPLVATGASAAITPPAQVAEACAVPEAAATTTFSAQAEAPPIATTMHLSGTTAVEIDIDAAGNVLNATVNKTSGFPVLDVAALDAARKSTFRSAIHDCAPVAGSYLFLVDFPE